MTGRSWKGLPGTEGTLKVAEPKRDKAEIFNEALKESGNEPKADAVTKKSSKKAEKPAEEAPEAPAGRDPRGRGSADAEAPRARPGRADAAETADADKPAEA